MWILTFSAVFSRPLVQTDFRSVFAAAVMAVRVVARDAFFRTRFAVVIIRTANPKRILETDSRLTAVGLPCPRDVGFGESLYGNPCH